MAEDSTNKIGDDDSDEIVLAEADGREKIFFKMKLFLKKVLGSRKAIILIAVSFILLISFIVVKGLFFSKEKGKEDQDFQKQMTAESIKTRVVPQKEAVFEDIVDLEPFERIPLKQGSTKAFISINLSVELTDPRYREEVYAKEEQIREIIKAQAQEMTWLELRNPEGKIMLKYNLLKQINSIFQKLTVRNIYFTNFIMQ